MECKDDNDTTDTSLHVYERHPFCAVDLSFKSIHNNHNLAYHELREARLAVQ